MFASREGPSRNDAAETIAPAGQAPQISIVSIEPVIEKMTVVGDETTIIRC